jgi:hypothetical protein
VGQSWCQLDCGTSWTVLPCPSTIVLVVSRCPKGPHASSRSHHGLFLLPAPSVWPQGCVACLERTYNTSLSGLVEPLGWLVSGWDSLSPSQAQKRRAGGRCLEFRHNLQPWALL